MTSDEATNPAMLCEKENKRWFARARDLVPLCPITVETLLLPDTGTPQAEWVEGEAVLGTPLTDEHSAVHARVPGLSSIFVETRRLGIIRTAMRGRLGSTPRSPHIHVLAPANRGRLRRNFIDGPSDWVITIVSPDSIERDRITKRREHDAVGVREYWALDHAPARRASPSARRMPSPSPSGLRA